MIVFLLLVIIAILLFGAGAVLGAIGWIAGAIFGLIALIYAVDQSGITATQVVVGFFIFSVLVAVLAPRQNRDWKSFNRRS